MTSSSPINLLFTTYHLNQGGVEQIILTYAKGLDSTKYKITVACLEGGTIAKEIAALSGISVNVIQTKSRVMRFLEFLAIARKTNPMLVHNQASWYGLIVGYLVGAKCVEMVQSVYQWLNWHERIRYGIYCLFADKIVAVSEAVQEFTLIYFPFMSRRKFKVIYNSVDPKAFTQVNTGISLRAKHEVPLQSVVVGFVGRLTEQKGVTYFLQAASAISQKRNDCRFIIVGDGELRDELQEYAKNLNLENIVFAGYQRDVPAYLAMFDIFVLPSLWEGLPVALVEAMAAGKPVVATAVSGTPEVVTDGETGFLVEPKNADQLAERITRLIEDPSLRDRMGRAARIRVKEKFSAATMIRATEQLYQELLESQ